MQIEHKHVPKIPKVKTNLFQLKQNQHDIRFKRQKLIPRSTLVSFSTLRNQTCPRD